MRTRVRYPVSLYVLLGLIALAATGPARAQIGYDRRGSEYLNFAIRNGDPAVCAERCERDAHCRAWSFAYPRTANVLAICSLKSRVPPRVEDKCCVSGVRGAGVIEPRRGSLEYSIERVGGDYRTFETAPETAGAACKTACESDSRCRAFTYMRPGYGGANARCYLKNTITRPRHRPCCISGVVR